MAYSHRLSVLLILVAPALGRPIIIRHDRADALYVRLARRFPAVCRVAPNDTGTLVGKNWVLTAGHVGADIPHRRRQWVEVGGKRFDIDKVFVHPKWREMGPHDVALIRLRKPVTGIEPMSLYRGRDEAKRMVYFVGFGGTGTGLTGPRTEDGICRAATNRVERTDADWLYFVFDEGKAATDLEGISGPGDSGGPAVIVRGKQQFVAGVSVWGKPGKQGRGTYGAQEGYTRISTHMDWLSGVMGGHQGARWFEPHHARLARRLGTAQSGEAAIAVQRSRV